LEAGPLFKGGLPFYSKMLVLWITMKCYLSIILALDNNIHANTTCFAILFAGFIEFTTEVTGTDKTMKMLLTSSDFVSESIF
jgi:hypothetical protein